MILVDVLAISVVLCVLSLVALALLSPSDREFVPALIRFPGIGSYGYGSCDRAIQGPKALRSAT